MWKKIKSFLYEYWLCIFIALVIFGNAFYHANKYARYRKNLYDQLEVSCNEDNAFGLRGKTYICINVDKVKKQCGKEN